MRTHLRPWRIFKDFGKPSNTRLPCLDAPGRLSYHKSKEYPIGQASTVAEMQDTEYRLLFWTPCPYAPYASIGIVRWA